jgi:hypothetical protein
VIQNPPGPRPGGTNTALGVTGSQVIKGTAGTLWSVTTFTLGTIGANGNGGNFYDSATIAGANLGQPLWAPTFVGGSDAGLPIAFFNGLVWIGPPDTNLSVGFA